MIEGYTPQEEISPTLKNPDGVALETQLDIAPIENSVTDATASKSQETVDMQIETIRTALGVPGSNAQSKSTQEQGVSMRDQFLSGSLAPDQFLAEIFSSDQNDPRHLNAEKNLSILNYAEIAHRLGGDSEYKDEYQNARSLSAFHVAQQRLGSGDIASAAPFLEIANSAAVNVAWENYAGWQNYIKATIAYTNGDVAELSRISDELQAGDSYKEVLDRLKSGLERGEADYVRDYGGL